MQGQPPSPKSGHPASSRLTPATLRRIVLEQSKRANVGHIGSALSIAELLVALYGEILDLPTVDDPDRDRFVLSKGHAALALYAALHLRGLLPAEALDTYCGDDSLLGVHPDHQLDGIDFSTGSLGHGLSMGAGAALGARLAASRRRVFVLISDAECNEGSLWESVMFAAHHGLANLVAIVDANGQQALGYTDEVLSLSPLAARFGAFEWDVQEVDGHDVSAIVRTMRQLDFASGPPHVVVAHTTFGKGVSFMERQIKWHYWPMSDEEFERALREVSEEGDG